jgi:uncharacterized DUF497 family protein
MVDLASIEGFEWDTGNARKNEKHGVSQQEAEQVFLNQPLLLLEDTKHSGGEPRIHALGAANDGRLLHISFHAAGVNPRIFGHTGPRDFRPSYAPKGESGLWPGL